MRSIMWDGHITRTALGLCYHVESLKEGDLLIRDSVNTLLDHGQGKWKPGTFWAKSTVLEADEFEAEFSKSQADFDRYYEGIQSRFLGTAIVKKPKALISDSKCVKLCATVRRIHNGYALTLIAFARKSKGTLSQMYKKRDQLQQDLMRIVEILEGRCPQLFQERLLGPPTTFWAVMSLTKKVSLESEISDPASQWSQYLSRHFVATGLDYARLPRSIVDQESVILRHPSYHYSTSLAESYLILPLNAELTDPQLVRQVDTLSHIEYFYTRFLYLLRLASGMAAEIQAESSDILSPLMESTLQDVTAQRSYEMLMDITNRTRGLIEKYPKVDMLIEEASHMHSDARYVLDGILTPSVYSQLTEKRLADSIEGVAESIRVELEMRLHHIREGAYRSVGRSFSTMNSLSSIIRAHFDSQHTSLMLRYTRQIKLLTILLSVVAVIAIFIAVMQLFMVEGWLSDILFLFLNLL